MNISKKAIELLKEIAAQRITQDNFATRNPIYLVQRRKERIVDPDYDSVDVKRLFIPGISDNEEISPTFEDVKNKKLRQTNLPYKFVIDLEKCENIEEMLEMFELYFSIGESYYNTKITNAEYYWETVAYFLILEDAKEYQQYQKHNLGVSRIYADYIGYGNVGTFAKLIDLFDTGEVFEK